MKCFVTVTAPLSLVAPAIDVHQSSEAKYLRNDVRGVVVSACNLPFTAVEAVVVPYLGLTGKTIFVAVNLGEDVEVDLTESGGASASTFLAQLIRKEFNKSFNPFKDCSVGVMISRWEMSDSQ